MKDLLTLFIYTNFRFIFVIMIDFLPHLYQLLHTDHFTRKPTALLDSIRFSRMGHPAHFLHTAKFPLPFFTVK